VLVFVGGISGQERPSWAHCSLVSRWAARLQVSGESDWFIASFLNCACYYSL